MATLGANGKRQGHILRFRIAAAYTGLSVPVGNSCPLPLFTPLLRAFAQIGDPVFTGVVWRCLAWSAACFAALHGVAFWGLHHYLNVHGAWAWAAGTAGAIGASLLALWLFLPVAAAIGMMYMDRIALAVERRFYPGMPQPAGESLTVQAWDGAVVALKVLGLNVLALLLAVFLPVVGWALGWAIGAYAIGRGLFVAVAMRRLPRPVAEQVYRHHRSAVLAQGAVLALAAYVPIMNLLIPVIGTAAMVHLLDMAMTEMPPRRADFVQFNANSIRSR